MYLISGTCLEYFRWRQHCPVLSAAHRRSVLHPGQAEADLRKARAAAERAGGPKIPGALLQFMDDSRAEGEVRETPL
jgi:hypothetical protein